MIYKSRTLHNELTPSLIFFVWKAWKQNMLKRVKNNKFKPIAISWFYKAASLIRKSNFKYKRNLKNKFMVNNSFGTNYESSKLIKLCIIEYTFLYLLKPLFFKSFFSYNFELEEYLREFLY